MDEDDVNDPEYNIMMEDVDDDDDEEIRNDKATRVSSMSTLLHSLFLQTFFDLMGWDFPGSSTTGFLGISFFFSIMPQNGVLPCQ